MTLVRNETQRHSAALKIAGQNPIGLLPLNGRRWLWGNVIRDAVNTNNLADNTGRNASQQLIRKLCPVSGHSVAGLNSAQDNWTSIRALITHYTNGLNVG